MIDKYEEIFQDALGLLIKRHPFFGHIIANVVRVNDENIKTMSVTIDSTGKILLLYSTKMIKREIEENKMSLKNITAIVQHEVYHIINEHFLRGKKKQDAWIITSAGPMMLFNIACDVAINQFIDHLPEWTLGLDSFYGVNLPREEMAEIYYNILLEQAKSNAEKYHFDCGDADGAIFTNEPNGGIDSTDNTMGGKSKGNSDKQGRPSKEDIEQIKQFMPFSKSAFQKMAEEMAKNGQLPTSKESGGSIDDHSAWEKAKELPEDLAHERIKQVVKQAYEQNKFGGKGRGDLPAGVERMCKETLKPPYDFGPYLKRFVDGELFSHFEPTRKRPNRRFGYEYPGKRTVTKAKIAVIADTSGSMYDEDMAAIAKNLENINQYAQIVLFDVDAGIHDIREYSKRNFDKVLKGGGGTDFDDAFDVIEEYHKNKSLLDNIPRKNKLMAKRLVQDIRAIIVITDGGVCPPKKKPKRPVLWALTSRAHNPPARWGNVIYLDNKPENHRRV